MVYVSENPKNGKSHSNHHEKGGTPKIKGRREKKQLSIYTPRPNN
jgi:hypothetical protein